jgi:hypothetical protein
MAKPQTEPADGSGTWEDLAGDLKDVPEIEALPCYAANIMIHAGNVWVNCAGQGADAVRAQKMAAAVGMSLQMGP